MNDVLRQIAASTTHSTGVPFLSGPTKDMRHAMGAPIGFITIGIGGPSLTYVPL